ncbi:MAG: UDP-N-acetylmuramate dehydrogenase [Rickettsiales bacterium]|jgi:UDP-N-acetylmuramate dehydrogenase|nr:UDP-N-acetylmuramate dehydrogenase [Rickettsiales bacterium]
MQNSAGNFVNLKRNEDLSKYTNFGCGGAAELFFAPETEEELIDLLRSRDKNQKITVLGGGTNLLIRDGGVDGLTILTKKLSRVDLVDGNLVAWAGTANSKLFSSAKDLDLGGFEFLGCIPGTVGGACAMNAGCYGFETKDILVSVDTVDFDGNVRTFSVSECAMGYRKNGLPKNLIFLRAAFRADRHSDKKKSEEIFRKMLEDKIKTQPLEKKTCGCTFKNPPNIPAWKVIRELGLQGVDLDGAKFSEKHANFLVNNNNATATGLENLINLAKARAREKMALELELELKIIGNGIL